MQQEIWRPTNYPNYLVSSLGRVMATRRVIKRRGLHVLRDKILKPIPNRSGYLCVGLGPKLCRKREYIHRLVAQAFIPNPSQKPQVNHKDGDKTNNCIENLEWVTASENQKHRYRALNSPLGNAKRVRCVETGVTFRSCRKAGAAFNMDGSGIGQCLNGKQQTCGGFHWEIMDKGALK